MLVVSQARKKRNLVGPSRIELLAKGTQAIVIFIVSMNQNFILQ